MKVYITFIFIFVNIICFSQKKQMDEALSKGKGRDGKYHASFSKAITSDKFYSFCKKNGYKVYKAKTTERSIYGSFKTVVLSCTFLTQAEHDKIEKEKKESEERKQYYAKLKAKNIEEVKRLIKEYPKEKKYIINTYYYSIKNKKRVKKGYRITYNGDYHLGFADYMKAFPNDWNRNDIKTMVFEQLKEKHYYNKKDKKWSKIMPYNKKNYDAFPAFQADIEKFAYENAKEGNYIVKKGFLDKFPKSKYTTEIGQEAIKQGNIYNIQTLIKKFPALKNSQTESIAYNLAKTNGYNATLVFFKLFPNSSYKAQLESNLVRNASSIYECAEIAKNYPKFKVSSEEKAFSFTSNRDEYSCQDYLELFPQGKHKTQVQTYLTQAKAYNAKMAEERKKKLPSTYILKAHDKYSPFLDDGDHAYAYDVYLKNGYSKTIAERTLLANWEDGHLLIQIIDFDKGLLGQYTSYLYFKSGSLHSVSSKTNYKVSNINEAFRKATEDYIQLMRRKIGN